MRPIPQPSTELLDEVEHQAGQPTSPLLDRLTSVVHERFGDSLVAILLYGSCLHDDDVTAGLVDFYAIVDDYRSAYPKRHLRWFNRWLPPNVFYVETEGTPTLRAKYAVLSLAHLERACTEWFHSYAWARFAQPVRLLHVRDDATGARVRQALARAVLRFLEEAAAAVEGDELTSDDLWKQGLALSYAAELRAESAERAQYLVDRNASAFAELTARAASSLPELERIDSSTYRVPSTPKSCRRARRAWALRRWQGRVLSLARLGKALFTFEGGVDYIAWKVERHTGESFEVTPRLRKYPLIFGWGTLWRLLRRGTVR